MSYLGLSLLFLAGAVVFLAAVALVCRPDRTWWAATGITALVMLVLTIVFDNVMIAADLFRFDEDALWGVKIGVAPVEDLAWPLAASAGLPALWLLLTRRPA